MRGREIRQALETIRAIATEMQKPKEGWNWENVLDWSGTLLKLAEAATDAAAKLAPYLPVVVALSEQAKAMLR